MALLVRGEVYAHVARGLLFDGRSLTLVDLAPSTIWSSPVPASGLGYLPTGAFLDLWADQSRVPGPRPVRGTLSLLDPDAQLAGHAVLALRNPRMTAAGLAYEADVVEGLVPADSGACVLFLEWSRVPSPAPDAPSRRAPDEKIRCPEGESATPGTTAVPSQEAP